MTSRLLLAFAFAGLVAVTSVRSESGAVKGRLVWGGDQVPEREILVPKGQAAQDPQFCASVGPILSNKLIVDPMTKGVRNAFACLVRPRGENPERLKDLVIKAPTVMIDLKGCEYVPHTAALLQGQPIEFRFRDPVVHNVRVTTSHPYGEVFPPGGCPGSTLVKRLEADRRVLPLTCDIHPWMTGYLMVFDHPYFTVTGADGSFEIKGVPTGEQNLAVWHESKGWVTEGRFDGQRVRVLAGQVTDVGKLVIK